MIEIEKKIILTPEILKYLNMQGKLKSEKTIRDTYFDLEDYYFTSQSIWIRKRDGQFEVKKIIPADDKNVDRYEEITEIEQIKKILGLEGTKDLDSLMEVAKIHPFANFITTRKKYEIMDLIVDVDVADFGDFRYEVAEVECMVDHPNMIGEAENKIFQFLKNFNLNSLISPYGKLIRYLQEQRPEHFKILKTAGAIR